MMSVELLYNNNITVLCPCGVCQQAVMSVPTSQQY